MTSSCIVLEQPEVKTKSADTMECGFMSGLSQWRKFLARFFTADDLARIVIERLCSS